MKFLAAIALAAIASAQQLVTDAPNSVFEKNGTGALVETI